MNHISCIERQIYIVTNALTEAQGSAPMKLDYNYLILTSVKKQRPSHKGNGALG
ncbi:hypothetical protein GCM10010912_61130 [Paenibacillus albidus]|uniref:Uncharacterized protein n=1 Tax=Paenibacillus albidus TaxID=2041023 RepID=A0A917D2L2_9BACL|nr:hypothetical protein GCM10010912_61130 [Paenibacillus albidus]